MLTGWLFHGILIKKIDQWTFSDISSDAQFNFYKDDFAVLKFY